MHTTSTTLGRTTTTSLLLAGLLIGTVMLPSGDHLLPAGAHGASMASASGVLRACALQTRVEDHARVLLPAGVLFLLDSRSARCAAGMAPLSWNQMGPQGVSGPAGPVGPQGASGVAGSPGATGPRGATGPMGSAGPAGPAGSTGSAATTGPAGPAGATGPIGPAGSPGATGPAGTTGPAGPAGVSGVELVKSPFYLSTLFAIPLVSVGDVDAQNSVACPAGKKVTGGGISLKQLGDTFDTNIQILESRPDENLGSWHGAVHATKSSLASRFTVWAICATAS